MEKQIKITVRVPESLFKLLDDKRHSEKVSFQEVGAELFRQWVGGSLSKEEIRASADEELVAKFLEFWRSPKGIMEPSIRDLVAKALGVVPPK
jgi:phage pi2 protein 07